MVCGLVVCVLDSCVFLFCLCGIELGCLLFLVGGLVFSVFCFFDADDFGTFCFLIVGVCFCWIVFWLEPIVWSGFLVGSFLPAVFWWVLFLVFVGEFDPGSG